MWDVFKLLISQQVELVTIEAGKFGPFPKLRLQRLIVNIFIENIGFL